MLCILLWFLQRCVCCELTDGTVSFFSLATDSHRSYKTNPKALIHTTRCLCVPQEKRLHPQAKVLSTSQADNIQDTLFKTMNSAMMSYAVLLLLVLMRGRPLGAQVCDVHTCTLYLVPYLLTVHARLIQRETAWLVRAINFLLRTGRCT